MSLKFRLGDEVKIVDAGLIYTTYNTIGEKYAGWVNGIEPLRKTKYTVIGLHPSSPCGSGFDDICAIQNASGQTYLYSERGLELVEEKELSSSSTVSAAPEPFVYPPWIEIKPYDGTDKQGLVVDKRVVGHCQNAACWMQGKSWRCNQSFRENLTPLEASVMLMALQDVLDNSPN